jgi:hypothetical protein
LYKRDSVRVQYIAVRDVNNYKYDYKFLDSLKGKEESEKYSIINKHYDDVIKELKNEALVIQRYRVEEPSLNG